MEAYLDLQCIDVIRRNAQKKIHQPTWREKRCEGLLPVRALAVGCNHPPQSICQREILQKHENEENFEQFLPATPPPAADAMARLAAELPPTPPSALRGA